MNRVLKLIHASYAYDRGQFGQQVPIAVLDTGVYPHAALKSQIASFHDFVNGKSEMYDDNGHGTHISGIIGGYLPNYQFHGIAPGCLLHIYKVLNTSGNGKIETLTAAIRDILANRRENRIKIINISVGMTEGINQSQQDKLLDIVNEAWKAGIVVVAAAGNNGPGENTVTCPGIAKKIITVGSVDDENPGGRRGLKRGYSGRGPTTECIVKPEILAPGTGIRSCGIRTPYAFSVKGGTSMAAPVVTGMLALLLGKYPNMTPNEVKMCLFDACMPIKGNPNCWGYLYMDRLFHAMSTNTGGF